MTEIEYRAKASHWIDDGPIQRLVVITQTNEKIIINFGAHQRRLIEGAMGKGNGSNG